MPAVDSLRLPRPPPGPTHHLPQTAPRCASAAPTPSQRSGSRGRSVSGRPPAFIFNMATFLHCETDCSIQASTELMHTRFQQGLRSKTESKSLLARRGKTGIAQNWSFSESSGSRSLLNQFSSLSFAGCSCKACLPSHARAVAICREAEANGSIPGLGVTGPLTRPLARPCSSTRQASLWHTPRLSAAPRAEREQAAGARRVVAVNNDNPASRRPTPPSAAPPGSPLRHAARLLRTSISVCVPVRGGPTPPATQIGTFLGWPYTFKHGRGGSRYGLKAYCAK